MVKGYIFDMKGDTMKVSITGDGVDNWVLSRLC